MGMDADPTGFFQVIGAIAFCGVVAFGTGLYFAGKKSADKKDTIAKMEWIADHHHIYGNRNGQLDWSEQVGISKELGLSDADEKLSYKDAKVYISLYDSAYVQR